LNGSPLRQETTGPAPVGMAPLTASPARADMATYAGVVLEAVADPNTD
jgi:hypothetical protein